MGAALFIAGCSANQSREIMRVDSFPGKTLRSSPYEVTGGRMTMTLALFFQATRLRNALNFSGSSPIASSSAPSAGTFAKFRSRSHDAVIRICDDAGNVIETHEHKGEFKEW